MLWDLIFLIFKNLFFYLENCSKTKQTYSGSYRCKGNVFLHEIKHPSTLAGDEPKGQKLSLPI